MSDSENASAKPQSVAVWADLLQCCQDSAHAGIQWAHECEDLDMTLLSWRAGKRIEAHVNGEVDVVLLGIEGQGMVIVNGQEHTVRAGVALLIPKGAERAIHATSERFSYLSLHKRRRGLMPTLRTRPE